MYNWYSLSILIVFIHFSRPLPIHKPPNEHLDENEAGLNIKEELQESRFYDEPMSLDNFEIESNFGHVNEGFEQESLTGENERCKSTSSRSPVLSIRSISSGISLGSFKDDRADSGVGVEITTENNATNAMASNSPLLHDRPASSLSVHVPAPSLSSDDRDSDEKNEKASMSHNTKPKLKPKPGLKQQISSC